MVDITLANPLLRNYFFYCSILVVKMMAMSLLTGAKRFIYKAFVNPEDASRQKLKPRTDENVERVRRAHLNDLENITLFFIIGYIYVLTNPAVGFATLLFRVYTIARIVHTFVYAVVVIPQPARALSWFVGYGITGYMAVQCILACL